MQVLIGDFGQSRFHRHCGERDGVLRMFWLMRANFSIRVGVDDHLGRHLVGEGGSVLSFVLTRRVCLPEV